MGNENNATSDCQLYWSQCAPFSLDSVKERASKGVNLVFEKIRGLHNLVGS